jgi:serine phosphatase RsbU (regulator of sigma subunit)
MNPPASAQMPNQRLELLYQLSQAFNSSLDFEQVLNTVMDEIIKITHAERGFIVLREPGGSLVFRAARGIHQTSIDDPQFQVSRGVIDQVIQQGQPVLSSDAQIDSRFSARQSVALLGLRAILCAPLKVRQQTIGAVYVDNRIQVGIFTMDDLELLSAIAASAAIAIENARLYQVAVEKARLERELQVARQVQSSLLPKDVPRLAGWDFAATWLPAREVAGDYYDFFTRPDGSLDLIIADVSDKGMPAALFMANSRSIVRAAMSHANTLAEGMASANRLIYADSASGMFLTLFYARVDPLSGSLTFVNAGHNAPLLYARSQNDPIELKRTGMALGVEEDLVYLDRTITIHNGDVIVLYTDGLTDAMNERQQTFDLENMLAVVSSVRHGSAQHILDALVAAVEHFSGSAAPFDDITLVIARRLS